MRSSFAEPLIPLNDAKIVSFSHSANYFAFFIPFSALLLTFPQENAAFDMSKRPFFLLTVLFLCQEKDMSSEFSDGFYFVFRPTFNIFAPHSSEKHNGDGMKIRKTILIATSFCLSLATVAQEKYSTVKDVAYVSDNDTSAYRRERCKLDIYHPDGKKGFKTLVWFHGGGLTGGNKSLPRELKNAGMAVVTPNYRLFPRGKCPDYVSDAAAAVAWTVRHISEYGGDPSQIYVGGHSAGGYLTLMLALDKSYLAEHGIDADSVKAYFPVSGQTATHYTIRKERGIPEKTPVVDKYAPLNNVRKLATRLVIYTGDRNKEMMARYEENLYLKSVLEGVGNKNIPLYELNGFNHGNVVQPACILIKEEMKKI